MWYDHVSFTAPDFCSIPSLAVLVADEILRVLESKEYLYYMYKDPVS